jgi:threonine dehydrogenase-like Zn-dependent dehydrogenase
LVLAPHLLIIASRGIAVGSRNDQQDLCDFIAANKLSLDFLIDKVFPFEDALAAFEYLYSGAHVGKVVIKL